MSAEIRFVSANTQGVVRVQVGKTLNLREVVLTDRQRLDLLVTLSQWAQRRLSDEATR